MVAGGWCGFFLPPLFSLRRDLLFGVVEIKLIQGWNTVLEKEDIYGKDTTRWCAWVPSLVCCIKALAFTWIWSRVMGLRGTNKFF